MRFTYGIKKQDAFKKAAELMNGTFTAEEGATRKPVTVKMFIRDRSSRMLEISSGLAGYGGGLKEFQTLLKAADYALYDAKNSGKGIMKQYSLN